MFSEGHACRLHDVCTVIVVSDCVVSPVRQVGGLVGVRCAALRDAGRSGECCKRCVRATAGLWSKTLMLISQAAGISHPLLSVGGFSSMALAAGILFPDW